MAWGDWAYVEVEPFRDLLIAASLKHDVLAGLGRVVLPLPRSIDRGLIEATELLSAKICNGEPFRDLLIAASLKQQRVHLCRPVGYRPFRDLLIAASLKQPPHHHGLAKDASLPRSIDRGLIEAVIAWVGHIGLQGPSAIY